MAATQLDRPDGKTINRERMERQLMSALGVDILRALETAEDIYANPDGVVWMQGAGSHFDTMPIGNLSEGDRTAVLNAAAALADTTICYDRPILEAQLPDALAGARFQGVVPPVSTAPCFVIRTRPKSIHRLADYVRRDILTEAHADALRGAIRERKNVLIVGAPGTGKTTLANALLADIASYCVTDRVISIEDTYELQMSSKNSVALQASKGVTLRDCVKAALRMRAGRLVIGEVRGSEALDLLKAWNTGYRGGVATVHANSAKGGLRRLEDLVRESPEANPDAHYESFIADTVNIVAFIDEDSRPARRVVREVIQVAGWGSTGGYVVRPL